MQSGPGTGIPVSGAAVTIYEAGTAYGAGAGALASTTTNSSGNFTIGFDPPATPTVLYLVALGGNAGSGSNTAIGLIGVAGKSNAIPASVTINELTTVAAEWGLAQFTDSTGQFIGAPSSNATGIRNAAAQAQANLADIVSGGPASFWSSEGATAASCIGSTGPINCDGLDRLDTIANILAACVESSGASSNACSTLLSNTGGSTTLAAAHVMATKPVAHVATLFGLLSGSPFTPVLGLQPDGWEIVLNFAPSGASFNSPFGVAIDAGGNAWVANLAGNSVTELTSSGALVGNFLGGANFNSPVVVAIDALGDAWVANEGGTSVTELTSSGALAGNFNNSISEPSSVAIDSAGDVWVPNLGSNSVTELTSGGGLAGNFTNSISGANFDGPQGVAIDAAGDVWVPNFDGNSVTELTSGGALAGNFAPKGANFDRPDGVAIDAAGNAWVTNLSNSVTELTSSGALAGNFNNSIKGANFDGPYGVAIDSAGNAWVPNFQGNSVTELTSSGALAGNFAADDAVSTSATFDGPQGLAIDAAGDVWVTNGDGAGSVAEIVGAARPVLTPLMACLNQKPPHAVCLP